MTVEVKVDASGRMVIPARLRRALGVGEDGGQVVLDEGPDGLSLSPHSPRREPPAVDEFGLVVLDVGREVGADEVADAIARDREDRDQPTS